MVRMVVNPVQGTPEDARALARASLLDLERALAHALDDDRAGLDAYTRAHFLDSRERTARALEAPMIQSPTATR